MSIETVANSEAVGPFAWQFLASGLYFANSLGFGDRNRCAARGLFYLLIIFLDRASLEAQADLSS